MYDKTNSSLTVNDRSGPLTIYSVDSVPKDLAMDKPSQLSEFSTGVGLLVLAVGFSSLGLLSYLKRHTEDTTTGLFSENNYSLIGSILSLLLGATFLTAAIYFVATKLRGEPTLPTDRFALKSNCRHQNEQTASPVGIDP